MDGADDSSAPLDAQPVFVYAARYLSNLPFEGPATVLLKEYQKRSVAVAANETVVQQRLLGSIPERKWSIAVADAKPLPPVVRLLGWLEAPPSDAAFAITGDNTDGGCAGCASVGVERGLEGLEGRLDLDVNQQTLGAQPLMNRPRHATHPTNQHLPLSLLPSPNSKTQTNAAIWLVYKFEGLKPLSVLIPNLAPPQPAPGLQSLFSGGREAAAAAAVAGRHKTLRTFAARLLGALSFCHARGVAHCCLGSGSVQCSGLDDRSADRMIVKLDNWGLARLYSGPLEESPPAVNAMGSGSDSEGFAGLPPSPLYDDDSDASQQRRADLQSAGLLLVESFVAGTAGGGAAAALGGGEALRRLLFEVFHDEVSEFREYCGADVSIGGGEGGRV